MGTKKAKKKDESVKESTNWGTHRDSVILNIGKFAIAKDDNGMYITHQINIDCGLLDPYKDKSRRRNNVTEKMFNYLKKNAEDIDIVDSNLPKTVEEYFETIKEICSNL